MINEAMLHKSPVRLWGLLICSEEDAMIILKKEGCALDADY
jgi:hypothetical protein